MQVEGRRSIIAQVANRRTGSIVGDWIPLSHGHGRKLNHGCGHTSGLTRHRKETCSAQMRSFLAVLSAPFLNFLHILRTLSTIFGSKDSVTGGCMVKPLVQSQCNVLRSMQLGAVIKCWAAYQNDARGTLQRWRFTPKPQIALTSHVLVEIRLSHLWGVLLPLLEQHKWTSGAERPERHIPWEDIRDEIRWKLAKNWEWRGSLVGRGHTVWVSRGHIMSKANNFFFMERVTVDNEILHIWLYGLVPEEYNFRRTSRMPRFENISRGTSISGSLKSLAFVACGPCMVRWHQAVSFTGTWLGE